MVRASLVLVVLALSAVGCGSNEPYCGEFVDITGRAAVYCPGVRDDPVCDLEGQRAHFEETSRGIELVGGARPTCNRDFEVVCPTGTAGEAYCITDPEL